jgi:hypothetical protein
MGSIQRGSCTYHTHGMRQGANTKVQTNQGRNRSSYKAPGVPMAVTDVTVVVPAGCAPWTMMLLATQWQSVDQ